MKKQTQKLSLSYEKAILPGEFIWEVCLWIFTTFFFFGKDSGYVCGMSALGISTAVSDTTSYESSFGDKVYHFSQGFVGTVCFQDGELVELFNGGHGIQ